MNRIAFLSADNLEGYVIDDDRCYEPLRQLGWKAETISWRNPEIDWSEFAAAIIRSTWDYQRYLPEFLATLERIGIATRLANPLAIVEWNADKIYLRQLAERGARVSPTIWEKPGIDPKQIGQWFDELRTDEVVIKPTISANAENTFRINRAEPLESALFSVFAERASMVQPFMHGIVKEGEYSLFYFNGEFSHAILKTPKTKDFRVQEEHGGIIRPARAGADLLKAGQRVMEFLETKLLYARVDIVREGDELLLMELELIEPSLYLRMDENAPTRFARAIDRWLR